MPEIAVLLHDDMPALDAVGPYEVLARLPDAEVRFVASATGPKRTDVGMTALGLAAMEAGEDEARALQLVIEYDPDPPYDSGSLEKADAETQRRATEHMVPAAEEAR